jgi:endonuclease/exonuclease/phosphatase family metal-dependent hydrolase
MATARPRDRFRAGVGRYRRSTTSWFVALLLVAGATGCRASTLVPATNPDSIAAAPCRQVQPSSASPPGWWSGDSRSGSGLRDWCATVGPVVLRPSASTSPPRPIDRLAVVSWNLHVGAGDVDGVVARLRAGEFTGGEPVHDFILLLQEAYRRSEAIPVRIAHGVPVPKRIAAESNRGPDIDHFWRDQGFAVIYAPSMRNGRADLDREDRGNAIVSTLDLDRPLLIELPLERQRRVAVAATAGGTTTTGAEWTLRLVDVHFDTALALRHGGPFAARHRQAEALIAAVRGTTGAEARSQTTIVAGDFNTWGRNERALDALAAAFPSARDRGDQPTWIGRVGLRATLDHVFAAGSARVEITRLPDRFGSDHYPLLAVITF